MLALFGRKPVYDKVDGVDDEPATRLETLFRKELDLMFLQGFLHIVPERSQVGIGCARGNYETVCQGRFLPEVEEF